MKIDIHTLCSDLEQEPREPSARNVATRTLAKVGSDRPVRFGTRRLVAVLAAAAVLAALSLGAYAVTRAMRVQQVENPVYTLEGETMEYTEVENVLQFDVDKPGNVVAFRTGWLPDGAVNLDGSNLSEYMEDCAFAGKEVPATALSEDVLEESLTHLCLDYPDGGDELCPLTVDVYSVGTIQNRDFLVEGETTLMQESELNGLEALYMETNYGGMTGRYLVLHDAERGCAVVLSSLGSFETLEQVARGLELVDTDIVSEDLNPEMDWSCLPFGGAKG